jgi:hypothetical protein
LQIRNGIGEIIQRNNPVNCGRGFLDIDGQRRRRLLGPLASTSASPGSATMVPGETTSPWKRA